ncbi:MAG: hypothetical protein ACRBCK_01400 [Alphaproteobacteria bacterium]
MTDDPAEKHHDKTILGSAIKAAFQIGSAAADAFETQKKLTTAWAEALNPLNMFLRKEERTPLTQDDSVLEIQEQFSKKYGAAGITIVTDFAKCRALNGGKQHKDEEGYFAGQEYSIPGMFYLMDRALSEHNSSTYLKGAYDQFEDDVERMFDKNWTEDTPLPSQKRLQDISRSYLKQIRELPTLNEEIDNEDKQEASIEL